MKRLTIALALALFTLPLFAVDDCSPYRTLGELYAVRSLYLKNSYDADRYIGRRLDAMREGWVRWVRPEGDAPYDKHGHTVTGVNGQSSDSFEAFGTHPFAVRVAVPEKRGLFAKNNPVYVGTVRISYEVNGRTRTKTQAINQWMNPDTSKTIDLDAVADRADASLDASTASNNVKNALVEIHFVQAVPRDDPANPAYETIKALERVRNADPYTLDREIATAERTVIPDADPVPMAQLIRDLRKADELMRSKKDEDHDKAQKLMQETLRRLRY